MELQSLVIGSDEIELSLGKRDGGREYMFVRLPLPDDEFKHMSINDVHLDTLYRVREVIDAEIGRLQEGVRKSSSLKARANTP
jgi:hypothetical protein